MQQKAQTEHKICDLCPPKQLLGPSWSKLLKTRTTCLGVEDSWFWHRKKHICNMSSSPPVWHLPMLLSRAILLSRMMVPPPCLLSELWQFPLHRLHGWPMSHQLSAPQLCSRLQFVFDFHGSRAQRMVHGVCQI